MHGLGSNPGCGLSGVVSATSSPSNGGISVLEQHGAQDHPAYGATFDDRRLVFGENRLSRGSRKSLKHFMRLTMKDRLWILLFLSAIISFALGICQYFSTLQASHKHQLDWVEGAAIIVAIIIVTLLGSLIDWLTAQQLEVSNKRKEERVMKVIRDGQEKVIDTKDVLVGDIALLEPGDVVPCDGIFLSGHNVRCDESENTGQPAIIRKVSYDEVLELKRTHNEAHADCFVLSGSKVIEGVGEYVVVAVGLKSFNSRMMCGALQKDPMATPLQTKLNRLAEVTAKIGTAAGLLLFFALMIRFFVQLGTGKPHRSPNEIGLAFINILTTSIILTVIAVPEGLPLALTFAIAFATKRMAQDGGLLVRVPSSCEKMAYASVICTDKTGILTQNSMRVVAGLIGIHAKFVRDSDKFAESSGPAEDDRAREHPDSFFFDWTKFNNVITPELQEIFNEAIAINSTAFEDVDPDTGDLVFVGDKAESALLQFAKDLQWHSFREVRESAEIVQKIPFSSERMVMGVVVGLVNGYYRFYVKGAPEILLSKCSHHVVLNKDGGSGSSGLVQTRLIDAFALDSISHTGIASLANRSLCSMALCYKDIRSWASPVSAGLVPSEQNEVPFEELMQGLTLISVIGIEDPLRPNIREAIGKCNLAGIAVKMCTGDSEHTARSIAKQCGILTPDGIVMEGPVFRRLQQTERMEIVPHLQVLARSSPEDKKILVETLKSMDEIVCVTGSRTADGPTLKTADIGFSMGIAGTEAAKEASDIILMDDNFSTIVKAIIWGRCICHSVRKLLQFQIPASITAVVISFVTALASDRQESILTPVQLLWINIIMDIFAVLVLATDPATEQFLKRMPERSVFLLHTDMYKVIMFQCIYQIAAILALRFLDGRMLDIHLPVSDNAVTQTLVFNTFVFCQIFNCINCRCLDRYTNIFEGILRNYYAMGVTLLEIGIQVFIVSVGGAAFEVTAISGWDWGASLVLGFLSLVLGLLVRTFPNSPFEKLFRVLGLIKREDILPSTRPGRKTLVDPINVRDSLRFMENIRGRRMRGSPFLDGSRSADLSQSAFYGQRPTTGSNPAAPLLNSSFVPNYQAQDRYNTQSSHTVYPPGRPSLPIIYTNNGVDTYMPSTVSDQLEVNAGLFGIEPQVRSSSPGSYRAQLADNSFKPPGPTVPPTMTTEEPTIKEKRKRADANQLKVLNEVYAQTAFPSTEEGNALAR